MLHEKGRRSSDNNQRLEFEKTLHVKNILKNRYIFVEIVVGIIINHQTEKMVFSARNVNFGFMRNAFQYIIMSGECSVYVGNHTLGFICCFGHLPSLIMSSYYIISGTIFIKHIFF